MKSVWTAHLNDEGEKKKFEEALRNSTLILDRLSEMLYNDIKKEKREDYNIPSWPYFQADQNGHNRAIQKYIDLITLTD